MGIAIYYIHAQLLYRLKQYKKGIEIIRNNIAKSNSARRDNILLSKMLISEKRYSEVLDLFNRYNPYLLADKKDRDIMKLMAAANMKTGKYVYGEKLLKSSKIQAIEHADKANIENTSEVSLKVNNDELPGRIKSFYVDNYIPECAILYALYVKRDKSGSKLFLDAVKTDENFLRFVEVILHNSHNQFVLIVDEQNILRYKYVYSALTELGYNVCTYDIKNSRSISDNKNNLHELTEFIAQLYGGNPGNNHRDSGDRTDTQIYLLCSDLCAEEICANIDFSKNLHLLFRYHEEFRYAHSACFSYGSYSAITSNKYYDGIFNFFLRTSPMFFSIIIPVRNTYEYLEYTLKTCLHQTFKGEYEILISDNSDYENNHIKEIVELFDDSRIRYIRAPRVLTLSESFEFAFLNARGRYIIAIGADDAVTSKALELLGKSINENKNQKVFYWNRASYYWPDFTQDYSGYLEYKVPIDIYHINSILSTQGLIDQFANGSIELTYLPSLYLRTCVHKDFIIDIINKTGKFEDGDSQDIYTGYLVLLMCREIIEIKYPIVISGVTRSSIGYNDCFCPRNIEQMATKMDNLKLLYNNRSYVSKEYENVFCPLFPYGNFNLLYRELVKVNRYMLDGNDHCPDTKIYRMLKSSYFSIPQEHCDPNYCYSAIKNIMVHLSKKKTVEHSIILHKWKFEKAARRLASIVIKDKRLKSLIKRALKLPMNLPLTDQNGTQRGTLAINNVENIFIASQLLESVINKQYG